MDFIKRMLSGKAAESVTRVIALLIIVNLCGWEWYAITSETTVPHVAEILLFIATALGWRQYNDRKEQEAAKSTQLTTPPGG